MDRPCFAGDAAIDQAVVEIAHRAEIIRYGKRDDSRLFVMIDMAFGIGGPNSLGGLRRSPFRLGERRFVAFCQRP